MSKIKVPPLPIRATSKNIQPVCYDSRVNLSRGISVVAQSSFAQLKDKLIYTVQDIFAKPKYFLVFVLARFKIFRQIYALVTRCYQSSDRGMRSDVGLAGDKTTYQAADSLFTDLDPTEVGNILKRDGVFSKFQLPQGFLQKLLQHLEQQDCYAGGEPYLGFKISQKNLMDRVFERPFYVARYYNISTTCPQIIQLANDPKLQEIAKGYIGRQAKYTGSSLFWTFPIEGVSQDTDQQKFRYYHYDIDDFAGLRFCFYLTDVSLEDGPHVCIRGSHLKKSVFHLLNYFSRIQTKEELAKLYEPDKFLTITGNSGTGFAEDTFCFHKGEPPRSQPRLFLQLHFAANNYHQETYSDTRDSNTLQSFPLA